MPKHFSFLWTPKLQYLQVNVTVLWQGHEFSVCAHVCAPPHPTSQFLNHWVDFHKTLYEDYTTGAYPKHYILKLYSQ